MTTSSVSISPLTSRQKKRSAGATIAGYQYQFERSIEEILGLAIGEVSRVEGIEDIDIWSENPRVIQIKYFEAKRWSLSVVRDAILEMLRSFVDGHRVRYILYVHFGDGEEPPTELNLEQLKTCLTYSPRKKPVVRYYEEFQEADLLAFIASLRICSGVSLEQQRKLTSEAIAKALQCDYEEADALHHDRAIQFLYEKARQPDEQSRMVKRSELLDHLDVRDIFYNKWHRENVGYEKFSNAVVRQLRRIGFHDYRVYRGVLLEVTDENIDAVSGLSLELANDMDGEFKKRTTQARPWTLVLRGHDRLIKQVKHKLIDECIQFNDGYELIHFSAELFTEPVVVNSFGKGSRLKRASHQLRVIKESSLRQLSDPAHQLTQLITLLEPESWHSDVTRGDPTPIYEISIEELTQILRRVTT